MDENYIEIYTDGACLGNPGPGGWAAILSWKGHERIITGGEPNTTNNRMELMATIAGLNAILDKTKYVKLYTDSQYVQKGITEWIDGWQKRAWKNVKNPDLWKQLLMLKQTMQVEFIWVKGHANNPGNERADYYATQAAKEQK